MTWGNEGSKLTPKKTVFDSHEESKTDKYFFKVSKPI